MSRTIIIPVFKQFLNTFTIVSLSLSVSNGHFPGEPGLASVYWSEGWCSWWWQLDYWSYVVQSSSQIITTNKPTSSFLQARCPSCRQPTVSKHWRENITFHGFAYTKLTWESSNFLSDHWHFKILAATTGDVCTMTQHHLSQEHCFLQPWSWSLTIMLLWRSLIIIIIVIYITLHSN